MASLLFFYVCLLVNSTKTRLFVLIHLPRMSVLFWYCNSLVSITLPDSMTSIGNNTFFQCKALKNVTFGSKTKSLRIKSFHYCESIETIILPPSVEKIEKGAFMNCPSLKEVIVSPHTKIEEPIFMECPNAKIIRKAATDTRYSFNESKGKDISPVELIEHPFGLTALDNKMLKKDYDLQMKKNHDNLKTEKDNDYYGYGMKSKIDISSEGKMIYLAGVSFDKLNHQKKKAVRAYWYLFSFDKSTYSADSFSQYVANILNKLQQASILSGNQTKKTDEKGVESVECEYKDRTVKIDKDSNEQSLAIHVIYKAFRF